MRISFAAMFGWVVPAGLLAGGLGVYPTWKLAGLPGLIAEGAAGSVVLLTMIGSGALIVWCASGGPARAAYVFIACSLVRMAVCMVLAAAAWALLDLRPKVMFVWLAIFYFVMLLAEGIWLAQALRRDAFYVALGKINRSEKRAVKTSEE